MPEDIGHFKVIIEGEVSPKLGDNLEKGFKKSSEKVGDNFKKELEKAINKTSFGKFIEDGKRFAQKIASTFGETAEKLSNTFNRGSPKIPVESKTELSEDIGKGASEGTGAGGAKGAGAGGARGALAGGIMALMAKISIGIGLIGMALKALDGLAPLQSMVKIMVSILQITLYPIAQFLLTILKPIIGALLKYLIIPFYYNVMPALLEVADFISALVTGDWGKALDIGKDLLDKFDTWLRESLKLVFPTAMDMLDKFDTWLRESLKLVFPTAMNMLNKFDTWLRESLRIVWPTVTDIRDKFDIWLRENLKLVWPTVTNILDKFDNWLRESLGITWPKDTNMLDKFDIWLRESLKITWPTIKGMLDKFDTWLRESLRIIWPTATDILDKFDNWLRNKISFPPPVDTSHHYTGLAEGGIVNSPTIALIGEAGPEAVIPLSKMGGIGGMNSKPNITINIAKIEKDVDVDALIKKIERELYTNMKRGGAR